MTEPRMSDEQARRWRGKGIDLARDLLDARAEIERLRVVVEAAHAVYDDGSYAHFKALRVALDAAGEQG